MRTLSLVSQQYKAWSDCTDNYAVWLALYWSDCTSGLALWLITFDFIRIRVNLSNDNNNSSFMNYKHNAGKNITKQSQKTPDF